MKVLKIVVPAFCLLTLTLALACQAPGTSSSAASGYDKGPGGEK
jgi:hypothetical protein